MLILSGWFSLLPLGLVLKNMTVNHWVMYADIVVCFFGYIINQQYGKFWHTTFLFSIITILCFFWNVWLWIHIEINFVDYIVLFSFVIILWLLVQNILHECVKPHEMWKYHNALLQHTEAKEFYVDVDLVLHSDRPKSKNHVTINCRWSDIEMLCEWEPNKMVRFKLVDTIPDVRASLPSCKPVMIPVFHMC